MCLKWEALLAEGERPRELGSIVVGSCGAGGRSGEGARLMLSWEPWEHASAARERFGHLRRAGQAKGSASGRR